MKPLSDFYNYLMPQLSGITTDLVDFELLQCARDFCDKTSTWVLPFDAVNLVASQATYDLEPSETQAAVVRITELSIAGTLQWQYREPQRQQRASVYPRYRPDEPPFSLSMDLLEITLDAALVPSAALLGGLQVTGAMKPPINATALPDFLLTQYSEAMRFGTLGRLMVMGGKPWSNPALAMGYLSRYEQELAFAAYQGQVGNTRQILRVRPAGI